MDPHDDKKDETKDEEQIASVLKTSNADAAPPDPAVLARLRAQSTEAFAASMKTKRPLRFRGGRWLGAAAAVVAVAVGLYFWLAPGDAGVAFGNVLEATEKADTLRVRLSRGNKQMEFWHTSKPNRSRWDDLDGNYRIADGATYWIVNEKANAARRTIPPAGADGTVDSLLDLLGVPGERAAVLASLPVERFRNGKHDVLLYRTEVSGAGGKILLEALANAETQRIHSIQTTLEKAGEKTLLAELTVLAYDEPIGAEKFAIADTLTDDGRIGKVTDVQGVVAIKPVLHDRWTPVCEHLVLKPGDWIRTDARGANATALRLVKQTGIILGPKTLVELIGPKQIRLIEGEMEITAAAGASIELLGPLSAGPKQVNVKGKQFFRVEKQQLARVAKDPPWLLGFKGATANQALGSLVALVDGRNVPLTVGYHKVTVDIRDQIARTVIEESFVNHTNVNLEGVFYFPLPQDASISGFGMWIGNNLVEADVVEKQRAREIFETILREKRDPGLLEWTGGNIFKARVFPIPAHAEKRIKISYTQVLPLKGNRYRYSYALQSELLQQHPLRELNIDVKVNSVVPLKSVTSPTHPTRDEHTSHSAHVEFSAQEFTPTRDFEVVVEMAGRPADVVMIPHRRGDDGYFMLQLTPPGTAGNWDRPLLPNGEPVNLLILADTSASIDAGQRATQATFIGSLLAALTPKDTFNLATCDVTCDWAFPKATTAEGDHVTAAREFLAKRASLGWTDLDATFAAALKVVARSPDAKVVARSPARATHVIYVGDGIVTAGDADPVAFTKRLRRLYHGHGATFHAVTLGSSYEPAVLKTIASLGSGSMRKITGEQGPALVARELLGEIAQLALRDVKVEFKGIKVARLYPETLANVAAGSQQILLGRYLPEPPAGGGGETSPEQVGEFIVTGTQGGKPVRFSTRVSLKDAEQGNSFIPRLWARMHLDNLLEQGSSEAIKDEIIALSEEFQIITPYTSLLVLETDADRERFKVKRRFQMRDGERFFADGRDNAVFELAQKQMKQANAWRTALRRSVLSDLARLGREARLFQRQSPRLWGFNRTLDDLVSERRTGGLMFNDDYDLDGPLAGFSGGAGMPAGSAPLGLDSDREDLLEHELNERQKDQLGREVSEDAGVKEDLAVQHLEPVSSPLLPAPLSETQPFFRNLGADHTMLLGDETVYALDDQLDFKFAGGEFAYGGRTRRGPQYGQWLNTLFPPLAKAPGKPKEPKSTWPAAARDLAKNLLRTDQLAKMTGGIEIVRQIDSFDTRWGDFSGRARWLELASSKTWLTRSASDGGQTLVSWCDAKEIGVFSSAFQLGRVRASTPLDAQPPPLGLGDHSLTSLERDFTGYTPTVEPQGKDRALLVLKYTGDPQYETRILIDTARHVILSSEDRYKDKVTTTTRFDDFVEVAGCWWAQRIETLDEGLKRRSLVTQTVKTLTLAELDQRTKTELAGRAQVQFLHLPAPGVADAKKAVAVGKAGFEDHLVLLLHFQRSQQWTRVLDHLQQAEKAVVARSPDHAPMPGMHWLRSAILNESRRHEELRQRYQEDAGRLAKGPAADAYFLAEYIVGQSAKVLQANEMLTLLDSLKALYDKQPANVQGGKRWQTLRLTYLDQAGRTDEAMRLRKQLATDYPRDYQLQQQYAQSLAGAGDYAAAYAWLTRVLVKESKWLAHEEESLRNTYTSLLQQQGRYAELGKYLAAWVEQNPPGRSAYEQYLSALIKSDQIDKADALALRWLKDAQVPDELSPSAEARLQAALNLMLGRGYQLYTNRVEERWLPPLEQAALFFARNKAHLGAAGQILWASTPFSRTEEARRVRKTLAGILANEIDKLPPEQVRAFIDWVQIEDAEPAAWKKITTALRVRWTNEANDSAKHTLGQALASVLSRDAEPGNLLTFLRLQWQTGPAKYRPEYAGQLFENLLAQPWSAEIENEALGFFDKLSAAEEPGQRLFAAVAALHRLTDKMLDNRLAARAKLLEHPEKLTRTELFKSQAEDRKLAREGLADRLRREAAKHAPPLGRWLFAESIYLDVSLDRNLKQAAAEAWDVLGAAPPKLPQSGDMTIERGLDDVLRQRYLVTLMNLAGRKGADPALVERLAKYIDQGINTGEGRWKQSKSRLLIALDRSKDLEDTLRQWTRTDDSDNRWRITLGYLLAEQGKLPEAIREFEAVEAADELSPAAYRALADWYLVQNQREQHDRAAAAVYGTMPEYRLSQTIAAKLRYWQRPDGRLPTELDKEVLREFAVLFDKSVRPEAYLHQLQQFYQASRDFRLLSGLPDAVVGHSAARVYPFVQGMQAVLGEVGDEATADEIVKRIAEVRPRARTAVDKRALDMLEVLVERRAAEVVNQPGPHREKALAALKHVSKGEWGSGEPRLMGNFLAGLGKITQPALADEQMRQLKALQVEAKAGSLDRLHLAHRYALSLNGYQRRADAIDLLQSSLDEFQAANDGVLPVAANDALGSLIDLLENSGHFALGEKVLVTQLVHPVHAQQGRWLKQRLDQLYHHALQNNGDVSLGKGATLYQALNARIQKTLGDADELRRYQSITLLCRVFETAHKQKLPGVVADLKAFAFKVLPPLLKEQTSYHPSIQLTVAQTVRDVVGPRDGIVFLVNAIEAEPRWLRYNNQDGWSRFGVTLADWRREAKELGDDEGRLLKLVLAELRRDLENREERSRAIYYQHNDHGRFWKEKAADFAKTAEAVLAERGQSGASCQYIADYFYWGLEKPKRAIEILFVAHNRKLLDEERQAKLVDFLHRENRHGESIAILQPLIERRPVNLDFRVQLMRAFFKTGRQEELRALLQQTDAFFHAKNRWGEQPLNRLAHSTLANELFDQSVAYFKELVPLHERTQPNRGIGNGTLSSYYAGLARAYAGLKKTPEAVEAAGGAIVAWGSDHSNRAHALNTLKQVLLDSPDLDAFVKHFDQQKQDSAIVRKALGQAYRDKKEHAKAIRQLELAAQLQPNDAEVQKLLIASYDEAGDKEGALRQLLQAVQQSRRDLKLFQELGNRFVAAGKPDDAERAYTSMVEAAPTEAESHALLAEVRQKQDRWLDAIFQWEQVARLRALEPTGLLKLADAQIHLKQWDQAQETLRKLDARSWPPHFGDVHGQVRTLAERLAAQRKK